jgi:nucleotide-binding universal stress UspA family protein
MPHAIAQAEHFQGELILLKVLPPLPERSMSSPGRRQAEDLSAQLAREYLEGVATGIRDQGIDVQVVTVEGQAHPQIVQFAEENEVDLIVMSTRGQSGLSRWLMGSVADRIVRGATVPVLLIRVRESEVE